MLRPLTDIGSHIAVKRGVAPQDAAAGTVTSTGYDRTSLDFPQSCTHHVNTGAASGTPTVQTVDGKLQESSDDSTYTDISGSDITQLTADNADGEKDVDLSAADRYIRQSVTVAFTGGSTPKIEVSGVIVFGGFKHVS